MCKKQILLAVLLMLAACRDDPPPNNIAEAARIEKEVARRVEAARLESSVRLSRLRTIRVVGFILLAGGAVAGLLWVRRTRFPNTTPQFGTQQARLPLWQDHYPPSEGRVIDPSTGIPAVPSAKPFQGRNPQAKSQTPQKHETAPRA